MTPGAELSGAVELGAVSDVSIMLRYLEAGGDIQRAIAVLQVRGSAHDHAIRQVGIDDTGLCIGEPLSEAGKLISGGAALAGNPPAAPEGTSED